MGERKKEKGGVEWSGGEDGEVRESEGKETRIVCTRLRG